MIKVKNYLHDNFIQNIEDYGGKQPRQLGNFCGIDSHPPPPTRRVRAARTFYCGRGAKTASRGEKGGAGCCAHTMLNDMLRDGIVPGDRRGRPLLSFGGWAAREIPGRPGGPQDMGRSPPQKPLHLARWSRRPEFFGRHRPPFEVRTWPDGRLCTGRVGPASLGLTTR
jgi:hypothetical protein